jgi:hypothetical protein
VKLNTDDKITFNLKDKVCEISIVMERTASQARKLYCIDFSVMRD